MKPHKHAELIKAWADGAEIEQACRNGVGEILWYPFKGTWSEYYEYRIKPREIPNYRMYFVYHKDRPCIYPCEYNNLPNLVLYFDGKTGELKSAEVMK